MRMREVRPTIRLSMSTTKEVENRDHLFRLIFKKLGRKGFVVTDNMIHVTHYGFDDRIDWDEHIIVVDGFGVFGFTDEPCPETKSSAASQPNGAETLKDLAGAEVEKAYGLAN